MEEKSGKIKYLPRTRAREEEGGGDYNDPTYGTASRVERAAGGWISLMTTVIPEL